MQILRDQFAAKLTPRAIARFLLLERVLACCSFGLPFIVYFFTLNSSGGQSENIVSLQSSMIQNHSLDVFPFGMDMIQYGGRFYNVYAPGLAFLSFPFAVLGFVSYGILNGYVGNAILMDGLFLSLCAAFSGYFVYRTSLLFTKTALVSLLASLGFTLGTSVWPYAVSVFPHDASLLFSLLAVYLVLRCVRHPSFRVHLLSFAGLSLGIATLVEYASGIFVIPLSLYILWNRDVLVMQNDRVGWILFTTCFGVVGIGLNFLYNYAIFRNPLEFPQQVSGSGIHFFINTLLLEHLVYFLISPFRGIFLLCPILLLGLLGLREMWKWYRRECVLFVSLFGTVLVYYSAWQGWDGAWAFGPRFLIIGLPYLVLPIAILLSQRREFFRPFLFLFVISSFLQGVGAIAGPSAPGRNAPLLFQPVSYAIPQILAGNTSVVWTQWMDPSFLLISIAILFATLLFFVIFIVREGERSYPSPREIKIPVKVSTES